MALTNVLDSQIKFDSKAGNGTPRCLTMQTRGNWGITKLSQNNLSFFIVILCTPFFVYKYTQNQRFISQIVQIHAPNMKAPGTINKLTYQTEKFVS